MGRQAGVMDRSANASLCPLSRVGMCWGNGGGSSRGLVGFDSGSAGWVVSGRRENHERWCSGGAGERSMTAPHLIVYKVD